MLEVELELTLGEFSLKARVEGDAPVLGVFGPSGSGKSSLLACIAGVERRARGRVLVDADVYQDCARSVFVPPELRSVGLVFQDHQLFPHLRVRGNLEFGLRLLAPEARRVDFDEVVDLLELGPLLEKRPASLSGGERQRVALGRSLLAAPRLLLLDEPLSSLDAALRERILGWLRALRDRFGIALLYVSHSLAEILELGDELVVLDKGRVLGHGPFLEIVREASVLDTAERLGIANVLELEVEESCSDATIARAGAARFHLSGGLGQVGARLHASIRPEDIALAVAPVSGTSIRNQIPGEVREIWRVGHRAMVKVDVGPILLAELSPGALTELALARGTKIWCLIKSQALKPLAR